MPNDSSTGGYLSPSVTPAPLEDDALDDALGDMIAAVTGLARDTAVLPRFQEESPNLPAAETDWVAFGVGDSDVEFNAAIIHSSTEDTQQDTLFRNEVFDLACSFYGPNARSYAGVLCDGLQIAQNREALLGQNMAVIDTGKPVRAPQMLKNVWFNRIDVTIQIRRQIVRVYAVDDLAAVPFVLQSDSGVIITKTVQPGEFDFSNLANSGLQAAL